MTNTERILANNAELRTCIEIAEGLPSGTSEDLEALGVLCDWELMLGEGSIPIITIQNFHPSYYLRCMVCDDNDNSVFVYDSDEQVVDGELVIAPNADISVYLDDIITNCGTIYVDSVRWTKNA